MIMIIDTNIINDNTQSLARTNCPSENRKTERKKVSNRNDTGRKSTSLW